MNINTIAKTKIKNKANHPKITQKRHPIQMETATATTITDYK